MIGARAGEVFAGYRIDGVLGSGGMGTVYEATQLSLGRKVALKVLAPNLGSDSAFRERFRREAKLQAALEHPGIVPVYEAGEVGGNLFLAMRLVRGSSLKHLVAAGELQPDGALDVLSQVADALDAAHEAGLIHRDVKPQNVLVDEGGRAFLADFGLTRSARERGLTGSGQYLGTLDYTAPEQIEGKPLSARSDVYALAAVLYECLAGEVPFAGESDAEVLYAHLSAEPPRISGRRPGLPPALDAVLARGLAKQPEDRFRSGGELLEAARVALAQPVADEAAAAAAPNGGGRRSETIADAPVLRPPPRVTVAAERGVPAWAVPVAAALVLLAAIAGFLAGRALGGSEPVRPTSVAVAGPVSLLFDGGWRPAAEAAPLPGLPLAEPIVLGSTRTDDPGEVRAGLVEGATGTELLPPAFRDGLERGATPEVVRLGRYEALRLRGLRHRQLGARLTLYALPTSGGVVAVACLAPPLAGAGGGEPRVLARCESVATTIRLRRLEPLPARPGAGYLAAVGQALTRLDGVRRLERERLSRATARREQASAAAGLSGAFTLARDELARLAPGPVAVSLHRPLVEALGRTAAAYAALGSAAADGAPKRYAEAAKRAQRSEALVVALVGSLDRLAQR